MNALHETLAGAAGWLWPAAADHLWQSTLFAAGVLLVTLVARRSPARVRHALWLVAAAKFFLPSQLFAWAAALAGLDSAWPSGRGEAAGGAAAAFVYQLAEPAGSGLVAPAADAATHSELYCALTLAWLSGTSALCAVWALRRREARRTLAGAREARSGREFEALARARRRLGLRADVRLVLTPHTVEPGVWGILRPAVVLPEAVAEHLGEEELETVLLHELVHVGRRDNLWGNVQAALACLYWFHPLVWLVNRRLLEERELACDEKVLETGGEAEAYASGILKVVRFCCGWRAAGVAGVAAGTNLRRRIEEIMRGHVVRKQRAWQRALPPALIIAALAFTAAAGLVGGRARAALVPADSAPAAAEAGQATVGGGAQEYGPATEEIMRAPEVAIHFEGAADSPFAVASALARVITPEQLRRADAEGADSDYDEGQPAAYVTLPTVTVTNVSDKTLTEVGLGFERDGKFRVITRRRVLLRPGESSTLSSEWGRRNVIIEGDAAGLTLRPVTARFEDGRRWGVQELPPPLPPLPPAPSLPPPPAGAGRAET